MDCTADHQERINRVLLYIREHIGEPLRLGTLARVACYSPFHFHRIFQAHTRETLHAHIRRLRLERAAQQLGYNKRPITDIALMAGYETPSAFTTAFAKHFGISPSRFRKQRGRGGCQPLGLASNPNQQHKEHDMEHEYKNRQEQQAAYVRRTGNYKQSAQAAWEAASQLAGPMGLMTEQAEFIGISHDDPSITDEDKLRYDACITVARPVESQGELGVLTIPGGAYAVFTHKGPYDGLAASYGYIYGQWLPTSGKELRDLPTFEKYLNDCSSTPPDELITEIYLPIQ